MKIIRYQNAQGKIAYAQQTDQGTFDLEGDPYTAFVKTMIKSDVSKVLAPIVPTQILCIGLNYRKHAEECGAPIPKYPVLFVKGNNALQNPGDPISLPRHTRSDEVDYEGELGVIIGKACKNVKREEALNYVLGYTCVNDVSARDWQLQRSGGQWCKGKSFDTFAPIGPCLVTSEEIPNSNALQIKTVLNGATVQNSNTSDMIFDIPTIIEFLSGSTTLVPGTLILTGTPQGVGMASKPPCYLKSGDSVTIEIEKIGSLTNPVIEEIH